MLGTHLELVEAGHSYDALNRLTSDKWSEVSGASRDTEYNRTISYEYVLAGNRTLKRIDDPSDGSIDSHTTYTYAPDSSDRLWTETQIDGDFGSANTQEVIEYRRDSNGFLIHKFTDDDGDGNTDVTENYTPSAEGKLAQYQKNTDPAATFTYDHSGERIRTVIGSQTIDDLVTRNNPTGYSQVLTRTDSGGQDCYNIIGDDILT
jgi:hypothetical protein